MSVIALGLNHHTAPLDLRGRFAFAPEQLSPSLQALRDALRRATPETAILSTCNRTELYVASATPEQGRELVRPALAWLAERGGVSEMHLQDHTYVLENREAARHAFRVASGLDSMVLGEPQILGQMKQAVRGADEAGTLGTTLHQLFQRSFSVAKEVRTSTEIGSHSISMAAATVRLAAQLFEDLSQIKVLFVGAGEMIELVATHFAAREPRLMAVANRTLERGEKLATRFGAQALRLAELPSRLHEFDAVISCTASSLPIIGLGAVESALKARRRRPMFMVDLAVPRDIEPEVAQLSDVYIYTVDDLTQAVQTATEKRQAAVTLFPFARGAQSEEIGFLKLHFGLVAFFSRKRDRADREALIFHRIGNSRKCVAATKTAHAQLRIKLQSGLIKAHGFSIERHQHPLHANRKLFRLHRCQSTGFSRRRLVLRGNRHTE